MSSLFRLMKYPLKYYWYVVFSIISMVLNVYIGFVIPTMMIKIIDVALPNNDMDLLLTQGGLMVLVALGALVLSILNTILSQKVSTHAAADLRLDLFKKIQSLSFTNIDKFKTSRLITSSTNDIQRIQQFFDMLFRIIVRAPLMFGIGLFMAIRTSVQLSSIFYISLPLLIVVVIVVMIVAFPRFMKVQKTVDGLNKATLETANAPRVIKSFVSMDTENTKFNDANELYRTTNTAAEKVMAVSEPVIMMIFNASLAGLIFFAAYYFNQGELISSSTGLPEIGILLAFNNYSMQILFGLLMFAMVMIFMSRALASSKRVVEVLDEEIILQNCEDCIETFDLKGAIEFKNVSFGYGVDSNEVLTNISFAINPGEKVGIIGSTGSGKSSIIGLIPRLYDVTDGEILIDGTNIKKLDIKHLRSQMGIVTQTATIFSGSIGTNLVQGKTEANMEDLNTAVKKAQAEEFVVQYEDLFNHEIKQKGTNLSGGQKQRLSIARAFIRNPKVLIFDDSTSAVDAKSEELILAEIDKIAGETTTIMIAQKISTVSQMDRIIVLNNKGGIDGFDTHENLMKNSLVYQEIALSQIGGGVQDA